MTALKRIPPDRLDFWSLIGWTLCIIKERPLFFFGLAALATFPGNLMEDLGLEAAGELSGSLLGGILEGLVIYDIFRNLEKNPVSLDQALTQTLRWPLLGIVLMWWLVSFLFSAWSDSSTKILGPVIDAIIILGLLFYLITIFTAAIPACVVEELGFLDSFKRSLALTKGHRTRIFLIFVGYCILCLFPLVILIHVLPLGKVPPGLSLTDFALDTLANVFFAVMYALIYYDLRVLEKERGSKPDPVRPEY